MKGLGLHCAIQNGRPRVVGVLAEGTPAGTVEAKQVFSHISDAQEDLPLQLANLSTALASLLPGLAADAVVVREMDYFKFTRNAVSQMHNQAVGVLLAIARDRCETTRLMSGRDIGTVHGTSKAQAEKEAADLVGQDQKEAGAAALAALKLAG
jgi:hypothetical protein